MYLTIISSVERQSSVLVQLVIVVDVSCCWAKNNCHRARNVVALEQSASKTRSRKRDETKQLHQLRNKMERSSRRDSRSRTNKTKWLPPRSKMNGAGIQRNTCSPSLSIRKMYVSWSPTRQKVANRMRKLADCWNFKSKLQNYNYQIPSKHMKLYSIFNQMKMYQFEYLIIFHARLYNITICRISVSLNLLDYLKPF